MKENDAVRELIFVTKENFHSSLSLFKKKLESSLLKYISFNCDISTEKKLNQELIFSEFSIVHKVNTNNDIDFQIFTFLIPSIQFHKYEKEDYVSFSPIFLKYLLNYKDIYDFNKVTSLNSITYESLEKENILKENLERILIEGKAPKKDASKSYNYYPKALELPSKNFQKQLIEDIKKITENFWNTYENEVKNKNIEEELIIKNLDITEDNYKLIKVLMDFKWVSIIFRPFVQNMFRLFVNKIKISLTEKLSDNWKKFMNSIQSGFSQNKKENLFNIIVEDEMEDYFYQNFCDFFVNSKISKCEFIKDKEKTVRFEISKENDFQSDKMENTLKQLLELCDKEEIEIIDYDYHGFDFRKLFENTFKNNVRINYSFGYSINPSLLKEIDLKKKENISYNNLFLNINNKEDIIYGYQFETVLHKLLKEIKGKDNENINKKINTSISIEFGKDLETFNEDKEFIEIINSYFDYFKVFIDNDKKYYIVQYILKKELNLEEIKRLLLEQCEIIKKKLLINEELGVSLFYKEIFSDKKYTIIGSNLEKKFNFIVKNILRNPNIENSTILTEIEKIKFFDLQYISRKINYNFFPTFMSFLYNSKNPIKLITQRFIYIFNDIKEKNEIEKYSNISVEENELKEEIILITKEQFNNNYKNVFKILKDITNFSLSYLDLEDKEYIGITILEKEKIKDKEKIEKEISNL
jgi:hypothetical protein